MDKKEYIVKVRMNKLTGQKTVTIPSKAENIIEDDLVSVKKVRVK